MRAPDPGVPARRGRQRLDVLALTPPAASRLWIAWERQRRSLTLSVKLGCELRVFALERLGWLRDVAQYTRHKVMAELGDMDSAREARQWSDRLGLSPMSMLRLRWQIVVDEVQEKREQKSSGARGRIRAV